jgi:hypothetical protein
MGRGSFRANQGGAGVARNLYSPNGAKGTSKHMPPISQSNTLPLIPGGCAGSKPGGPPVAVAQSEKSFPEQTEENLRFSIHLPLLNSDG